MSSEKMYTVRVKEVCFLTYYVEAESLEEAQDIVESGGVDYKYAEPLVWEIIEIKEGE